MTDRRRYRTVCALLLASAASTAATVPAQDPRPLASPDLTEVEAAVRRQLESARSEAERLLADDAADNLARAEAVGSLGRLYLLYSLLDSAENTLAHAHELASDDFRWSYYLGALLQRQGRLEAAAEQLGAALAKRQRDLPCLIRLGRVEIARNRPQPAALFFQRALEVDPSSAAALFGLAQVAALAGEYTTAVPLLEAVVASQPGASTAHYQLGLALRQLGDLERARDHLAHQGRGEVTFPDPLMSELATFAEGAAIRIAQANRAAGRGDIATAQAALESAVAADPDNPTARLALASNLIRQGELERAAVELEEVLARDPGNAAAHYNLATPLAHLGKVEVAIGHLRRAAELAPDFADAEINLAGLLRAEGRYREAIEALERALAIEPDNVALAIQRAEALDRAGRAQEAATVLREAAPATEGDAALLVLLARSLEARGDRAEAASACRRAVALRDQPAAAEGARVLARLEAGEGRTKEALAHLDTALELRPGWGEALAERAMLAGRLGLFQEAAADFAELIRFSPADEGPRMGRAVALLLAESYAEAANHLEESLAALPGSVSLRHVLARLLATCPEAAIRDGARALTLAQEVAQRERSFEHGQTTAMALAELGRFEEAAAIQRQLLQFAERSAPPQALADLRRRLASYERGEPERAPWLRR